MVTVHSKEDCGNAPKKAILQQMAIELANGDIASALARTSDKIEWEIAGQERAVGQEAVFELLERVMAEEPLELHIHHIITHGWIAALHATVTFADGRKIRFCDVYEFAGASKTAKIKQVVSYRVLAD